MSAGNRLRPGTPPDAIDLRAILLGLTWSHRTLDGVLERLFAPEQVHVLDWLLVSELASGASSLTALSRRLQRDPAALSRAIQGLVLRNLVRTVRLPDDRRRNRLMLTRTGHALHERFTHRLRELLAAVPDAIRLDDLVRLGACLDRAVRAIADAADAATGKQG